jgi:3'-5' exoribonuclease
MKDFYISDSEKFENKTVTSCFVVSSKQVRPRKTGELFLQLTLSDRTGQIDAKMWDNVADVIDAFAQDDFVKVKGLVNRYNTKFQFTIHKLRKAADSEIDFADYLPQTTKDIGQLWRTVGEFVASFKNTYLKALIEAFMADEEIAALYKTAPAAKTLHHAFIGGLLDHVVSLMQVADLGCRNYPQVDRDLLLSGVFLHDIGKIYELQYSRSFSYSTRGQLLGHMIIELEMLQQKVLRVPGFPPELKTLLEHLIISHHGHYEFGSPKLPMFPEALMLHYLDDLDSKMESMRAHFEREIGNEAEWTSYNPSLGRPLLNSRRMIERAMAKAETESKPAQADAKPAPGAAAAAAAGDDDPAKE